MGSKRKRWSPEEKFRIVLAGITGDAEISELCRREGISPARYYNWKSKLMKSASKVFSPEYTKPSKKEQRLDAELRRAKDVIAEITAENLDLKKGL